MSKARDLSKITVGGVETVLGYTPLSTTGKAADADKLDGSDSTTFASASSLNSHTSNTSNPHAVTSTQVGLGNVENKSSATIRGEITSSNVTTALGYTPQNSSTAITTSNIGSQSVNYATSAGSAGNADTLDGYHAASFLTSVPAATSSTLGGVKVSLSGTTLTITTT